MFALEKVVEKKLVRKNSTPYLQSLKGNESELQGERIAPLQDSQPEAGKPHKIESFGTIAFSDYSVPLSKTSGRSTSS